MPLQRSLQQFVQETRDACVADIGTQSFCADQRALLEATLAQLFESSAPGDWGQPLGLFYATYRVCGTQADEVALELARFVTFYIAAADLFDDVQDDDLRGKPHEHAGAAIATNSALTVLTLALAVIVLLKGKVWTGLVGMFITPVFWTDPGDGGLRSALYHWNPFTWFLDLVRVPILSGAVPLQALGFCLLMGLGLWLLAVLLAATAGGSPSSSRLRKMFSRTTMELSTIMPTPSASPPSVMRLSVKPPK